MCWWDERDPAKHPPLQPLITEAAGAVPLLPVDQGQRTGTCVLLSWAAYPDSKALIPGDPQAGTAATDSGERLWKRSWSWSWAATQWVMLRSGIATLQPRWDGCFAVCFVCVGRGLVWGVLVSSVLVLVLCLTRSQQLYIKTWCLHKQNPDSLPPVPQSLLSRYPSSPLFGCLN